jgi:hypothetical protein
MAVEQPSSLQHLDGYSFPVLYSADGYRQAQTIATRCERAAHYLSRVLGFAPTFRLLVLAPADWIEHAGFPLYGMPHTAHAEALVVGTQPADFWQVVTHMLDGVLTADQRTDLAAVYGTVDGDLNIAPFADLLVIHELGHLFHEQVPFRFPRLWLMEFFANFCLHAYLVENEPQHMPTWLRIIEPIVIVPLERVQHRSLDDFEQLYVGVGPANYVWYQFRLTLGVKALYDAAGVAALQRLYQTFANDTGDVSDQQLATILEAQVHPVAAQVLRTWPQ